MSIVHFTVFGFLLCRFTSVAQSQFLFFALPLSKNKLKKEETRNQSCGVSNNTWAVSVVTDSSLLPNSIQLWFVQEHECSRAQACPMTQQTLAAELANSI
jgi:hypothetical protein